MFQRPKLPEITERIGSDITSRFAQTRNPAQGEVARVFGEAYGGASHLLHAHIDYGIQQMLPTTATGEDLDNHARMWLRVPRKAAVYAEGEIVVTGTIGTEVVAGSKWQRTDGTAFVTTAAVILSNETATVAVRAEQVGAVGNTQAGVQISAFTPILGLQSVATVANTGISSGSEIETDSDLRTRILQRIQKAAQGGADYDYEEWALEVAGITRAWVLPQHMGLGTVGVVVVRDNDADTIIPDVRELEAVAEHIEEKRPVTAQVYVLAPITKAVQYRITVMPDTPEIRASVEAALKDFHIRESDLGGVLYRSRIQEAISSGRGEFTHTLWEPVGDVGSGTLEIPVFGGVTWPD